MTYDRDYSGTFWSVMLPVCWVLAPVLTLIAHAQARVLEDPAANRLFQSALFLAVFLAMFGLVAIRILIARAIDEQHLGQARLLGAFSAVMSVALIAYGITVL